MEILFVIIDGVADGCLYVYLYFLIILLIQINTLETQFKTLLQLAQILTINQIASIDLAGFMDLVEPGLSCGSDAHSSNEYFGYDPLIFYRDRGADMQVGNLAFKCNFAYMELQNQEEQIDSIE